MNPVDFEQQALPLVYKTKTIKRLDKTTYIFHCTTRNDAGGRVNRNMVVISSEETPGSHAELTLIDCLRITSEGERKLKKLGTIRRIVRLGMTMHGAEEDDYYLRTCPNIERWAPGDFLSPVEVPIHKKLSESGATPFPYCKVMLFKQSTCPEAAILLYRDGKHGNCLITGDCLQHQLDNEFINMPVVAKFKMAGLLESDVVVSQQWLKVNMPAPGAYKPTAYKEKRSNRPRMRRMSSLSGTQKALRGDFMRLIGLDFHRLLSTSGNVVKYGAKKGAVLAVEYAFPLWERSTRGIG